MTKKLINYALNDPRFKIGDSVAIIPTGKAFTIERVYYVEGFGWRYLSISENAGAYQRDLQKVDAK